MSLAKEILKMLEDQFMPDMPNGPQYMFMMREQDFKVGEVVVWTNPRNKKSFEAKILSLKGEKAEIEFEAKYDPTGEGEFETIIQEVPISELRKGE